MSLGTPLPDFDVLMKLYKEDPEAFEDFRKRLLRDAVNRAPKDQHLALELLLKRIDAAREATANPVEAMLLAFKMMQESLAQLRSNWEKAQIAMAELQTSLIIEKLRKQNRQ
jgi:hypothetical protein